MYLVISTKRTPKTNKQSTNKQKKRAVIDSIVQSSLQKALMNSAITESKVRFMSSGSASTIVTDASTVPYIYDATPTIAQGSGAGNRDGNRISIKKAKLSVFISQSFASNTNQPPWVVDVVIGYQKGDPNNPPSTSAQFNQLYYDNAAAAYTTSISNDSTTFNAPFNENHYKILHNSRHYIGQPSAGASNQFFAQNDFKSHVELHLDSTNWLPKVMSFQETTQYPQNTHGPYVWFFVRAPQGWNTYGTSLPLVLVTHAVDYKDF